MDVKSSILKHKKKWLIGSLLLTVLLVILGGRDVESRSAGAIKQEFQKRKHVKVSEALQGEIREDVSVMGFTQDETLDLGYNQAQGKVSEIYVSLGDFVKKGDSLFKMDTTSSLASLKLQLTELQLKRQELSTMMKQVLIEKEKVLKLYQAGSVSKSELVTVQNQAENLEIQVDEVIKQAEETQQKIDELDALGIVIAPEDGEITKIEMVKGTYLAENNYIRLKKSKETEGIFYLTENEIKKLEPGVKVTVTIMSQNIEVEGVVREIQQGGGADFVFPVSVTLLSEQRFRGGLSITMHYDAYQNSEAILVPTKSIIEFNKETYVYKIDQENRVTKTDVEKGISSKGVTEILGGLTVGDRIVSEGQFVLSEGDLVQ